MFDLSSIGSNVVALLGPTNTGKTHQAIERMLEHRSGMMGFPLRLLAQEVYERVCAKVGEQKVALLTGEERKIPKHARYWLCTVEAMPTELEVEFLAVDEIQLASDRERGHVFSQRLLKARGTRETWFLGSMSMLRVIRSLIPHIRVQRLTRLSTLRYGGRVSLSGLPPRTAVVALSRKELYPIAEHIRQRKGGVALVLGALSPNARNAQVELFQSGKVDYLVATDAIGMGLNLDLSHVVFASLSKFDGQRRRMLSTDELAQIAGRAGRHIQDGTFYTLHNGPQLDSSIVRDIEEHRFYSKTRLVWRNDELDFTSPQALIASLKVAPPKKLFQKLQKADDFEALLWLSARPAVRARLRGEADLRRLWTVCQIPDYRKLMLDRHFVLLEEIFIQLCERGGELCESWLQKKLKDADSVEGGIEVLMTRLAFVRTWSYVTHRPGWLAHPKGWQEAAREVEERLSAALHEALTLRFLEKGAAVGTGATQPKIQKTRRPRREITFASKATPVDEDHPFASLSARLQHAPDPEISRPALHWLERWIQGDDTALTLADSLQIFWDKQPVAWLSKGAGLLRPEIALDSFVDEQINAPERAALLRRLHAFVQGSVGQGLVNAPLLAKAPRKMNDAGRALRYALVMNAGITPWSELASAWRRGAAHGIEDLHEGWIYVYCKNSFNKSSKGIRDILVRASQAQGVGDASSEAPEPMPLWVRGLHALEDRLIEIQDLESRLQQSLGPAGTKQGSRSLQDPGVPEGFGADAWYGLIAELGWRRRGQGKLQYQVAQDRCAAGRVRAQRQLR